MKGEKRHPEETEPVKYEEKKMAIDVLRDEKRYYNKKISTGCYEKGNKQKKQRVLGI